MTSPEKPPDTSPETPKPTQHRINYLQQRFNWDCGVTCVLMLLSPGRQREALDTFEKLCEEEGFGQSTWTIDLCYLLKRFKIEHEMYTTNIGVNEDYRNKKYYDKIIDKDRSRVLQRFSSAASCGLSVRCRPLQPEQLTRHVAARGPALLLVDAARLLCDRCKWNKLQVEFRSCLPSPYSGHYILVHGWRERTRKVLYLDPARAGQHECSLRALRRAAGASGTDDDVILIQVQELKAE